MPIPVLGVFGSIERTSADTYPDPSHAQFDAFSDEFQTSTAEPRRPAMRHMNAEMEECIRLCLNCHHVCYEAAMNQCLEAGGQHVQPEHFRLMLNCAEICQTSANFMLSGSDLHHLTCAVCAEVCRRCADDCERIGEMEECVEACRSCADACAEMGTQPAARRVVEATR
jgi:hypothetical protein